MRVLLDHRFIRAHLQGAALHLDNVYTLTPRGAALLEGEGVENVTLGKAPRVQKLRHGLAIRDVFVEFRLAERLGTPLEDFRFEEDLATEPFFRSAHLVPDALALLGSEDGTRMIPVEVDLGSETTLTLRKKFDAWRLALARREFRNAAVLIVAPSERRATTLRRLLEEASCPGTVAQMSLLDRAIAAAYTRPVFGHPVRTERIALGLQVPDFRPLVDS